MTPSDIRKIIDFYRIVEKLCLVRRDVKLSDGRPENDTAHILKTAYLAMSVFPYLQTKVDLTRMLELALVHDLVEAECGDVPLAAQQGDSQLKKQKKEAETAAVKRYRRMLPAAAGSRIYDLFMEYENKSSREAQIVYVLDKLEADFQACRYGDVRYWGEGANGDWYYRCVMSGETPEKPWLAKLKEPLLDHLEAQCLNICRMAMIKSCVKTNVIPSELNYQRLPLTDALSDFMDIVEKLALVNRDNLLSDGTPESDADHVVKLCFLLLVLTPYLQNRFACGELLRLALIHDLPEALAGDVSLSSQIRYPELRVHKKEKEAEAAAAIRAVLPAPLNQQFFALFSEYEAAVTPESRLVKLLDKLEATLQSNLYHDGDVRYWGKCDCGDWYYRNALTPHPEVNELNEPAVSALQEEIIRLSRENILKSGLSLPETEAAAQ